VLRTDLDGERALVDADDLARAAPRRREPERARVRVRVEHALAAAQGLDARAELALIEVEAGLLSELDRDVPGQPPLGERERRDVVAADDARRRREALRLGRGLRGAVDDRPRPKDLREGLEDHRLALLHPERQELHDEDVVEPI